MPFTVLRSSKDASSDTEVIGEFAKEEEANLFAKDAMECDPDNVYAVERPPPRPETSQKLRIS